MHAVKKCTYHREHANATCLSFQRMAQQSKECIQRKQNNKNNVQLIRMRGGNKTTIKTED
jgi:hypothetical protein